MNCFDFFETLNVQLSLFAKLLATSFDVWRSQIWRRLKGSYNGTTLLNNTKLNKVQPGPT